MAEMNTTDRSSNRKGKPTKRNLRVDFTPMVDMNMLLITFFMFCTSLVKPQIMDIVMPTKDVPKENRTLVSDLRTTTLLLGAKNKIYYYFGMPQYDNKNSLLETDYSSHGLRAVLLKKNAAIADKVKELRMRYASKQISDEDFKKEFSVLKKEADLAVVIKPTDSCSYNNLVAALDEMQVCAIDKYAIVDLADGDKYLLANNRK